MARIIYFRFAFFVFYCCVELSFCASFVCRLRKQNWANWDGFWHLFRLTVLVCDWWHRRIRRSQIHFRFVADLPLLHDSADDTTLIKLAANLCVGFIREIKIVISHRINPIIRKKLPPCNCVYLAISRVCIYIIFIPNIRVFVLTLPIILSTHTSK